METFEYIFDNTTNSKVFFLGDIHVGSANHDKKAFQKTIDYIKNTKEPYIVILMGDMIDAINMRDPRFSPAEVSKEFDLRDMKDLPRKQMRAFYNSLKSIQDKVKFCIAGNHEETYIKYNGFDVIDYLCSDLLPGCQKLGFSAIGNIKTVCHKSSKMLRFALTHGTGGGGYREGYPVNHVLDIFKKYDCDIHVMGHVHKLVVEDFDFLTVNKMGNLAGYKKYYCVSGCYMKTYVSGNRNYFEGRKGMLSDIGFIELSIDKKDGKWYYRVDKIKYEGV
jgi:predicted phosphodiesterase